MEHTHEKEVFDERMDLVLSRMQEIAEGGEQVHFADYFKKTAAFVLQMHTLAENIANGWLKNASLEELKANNEAMYSDILGNAYETSYGNPVYAAAQLGTEFGPVLSALYAQLRQMIGYAYEGRKDELLVTSELFLQVYCSFTEESLPAVEEIKDTMYWFMSDYSELFMDYRVDTMVNPARDFAVRICMDSDLEDLRYLYYYGEYVTEDEIRTAQYLNSLPMETIELMAHTYSEGYRMGFVNAGIDLSKKETVDVRYHLGFERMIRVAVEDFAKMGLKPTMRRIGVDGASPNKQYEYDHREDTHLYLDKRFVQRRLEAMKLAFEARKEMAAKHAGPAVLEVFGEKPFSPEKTAEAMKLTEKQHKLSVELQSGMSRLTNTYVIGEERSFTIIAFPLPTIGDQYEEIFEEIIKINTLDYKLYERIQQSIIDALDQGERVHILGKGENCTDLNVSLYPLTDPATQTIFENCVADVNIPVGEVFTSPVLKGTDGVLFVSKVYLNDLLYKDLKITFKDGMITDYTCSNFEKEEDCKSYVFENVMRYHETLPLGEFAIGTNTTAYVAAQKYQIADKLPILIAEKMGPHFAVGDTCYSWSEEQRIYNPDKKEIVAKDNECSIKRKEDVSKAYFNTHIDITIPYDELGSIRVITKDGEEISIIEDGRFVLAGTEELNKPFEN